MWWLQRRQIGTATRRARALRAVTCLPPFDGRSERWSAGSETGPGLDATPAAGGTSLTESQLSFGRDFEEELELLVGTLPAPLRDAIHALPDDAGDLLEIVLDLGREPEARFEGHEVVLAHEPVTMADIACVADRIGTFVVDVGPAEIAFKAEHEPVELCVGADLGAAKKAPVVEIVVAAGERIAPGRCAVAAADMATDVEAAPIVDLRRVGDRRGRQGRGRRRPKVSGSRTRYEGDGTCQRKCTKQNARCHVTLQARPPNASARNSRKVPCPVTIRRLKA